MCGDELCDYTDLERSGCSGLDRFDSADFPQELRHEARRLGYTESEPQ